MIRISPTISTLNTREYFSTKETKKASKGLVISSGGCCYGCSIDLPAFANPTNPTDPLTNDRVDFIIDRPKNTTLTATLIKLNPEGTESDYIINNQTYGDYYPTGTIKANFWGFILDWYKVYNTLGFGRYKFNITIVDSAANEIYNETSACYRLMPFTCDNAHRTIKIKTRQFGYFEGGIDYTGINLTIMPTPTTYRNISYWPQEIRLYGRFHRDGTNLTTDYIVSKDRGQEQVQSQTVKTFVLKTFQKRGP